VSHELFNNVFVMHVDGRALSQFGDRMSTHCEEVGCRGLDKLGDRSGVVMVV
jgi:hypothetical protein